jgi:hypothetical protein
MLSIKYRKTTTYKYRLEDEFSYDVGIRPRIASQGNGGFLSLTGAGVLRFSPGYRWDGPSGPTIDTKNFLRGSLVHDGLYQLLREGDLAPEYRSKADQIIRRICVEDGMSRFRAWYAYWALRLFGSFAAKRRSDAVVETAPGNEP